MPNRIESKLFAAALVAGAAILGAHDPAIAEEATVNTSNCVTTVKKELVSGDINTKGYPIAGASEHIYIQGECHDGLRVSFEGYKAIGSTKDRAKADTVEAAAGYETPPVLGGLTFYLGLTEDITSTKDEGLANPQTTDYNRIQVTEKLKYQFMNNSLGTLTCKAAAKQKISPDGKLRHIYKFATGCNYTSPDVSGFKFKAGGEITDAWESGGGPMYTTHAEITYKSGNLEAEAGGQRIDFTKYDDPHNYRTTPVLYCQ